MGFARKKTNRFMELEGIRGLASLAVVLHHYIFAFFPLLAYGFSETQHMRYEDEIFGTPLTLAYAGTFAVAIFFVLSGFVLTIGFFQTGDESIIKKHATKRYIRLMLPALASTMICLLLIKFGVSRQVSDAAEITGSNWLAGTWDVSAGFFSALYSGAIDIFISQGSPYNNVLWTMMTEFIGSFIVFTFALTVGKSRYRWVAYIWLSVLCFNSWFLAFVLGMMMADLYVQGYIKPVAKKWIPGALLLGGLFLGSYPHKNADTTFYSFMDLSVFSKFHVDEKILYLTVGAFILILGVMLSDGVKAWLQKPKVSILGKYTFSLYLIHLPVLYSFTVATFLLLRTNMGYNMSVFLAFLLSIPILWVATVSFEKYVDSPSIRLARSFSGFLEDGKSMKSSRYIRKVKKSFKNRYIKKSLVVEDVIE